MKALAEIAPTVIVKDIRHLHAQSGGLAGRAKAVSPAKTDDLPAGDLEPDYLSATKRQMVGDTIVANWARGPFKDKCPNSFL